MLSARREQVLDLVAETHIRSARPVPSAFVAERLGVSSATVRNDFGVLEHDGFLHQPHTSAGRVPTTKGFEQYVRKFIPPGKLSSKKRQFITEQLRTKHGEQLLKEVAYLSAELSGYAVVLSLAADEHLHALEIHLSALSSNRVLAVVVLENGLVRQLVIELDPTPKEDVLRDAEQNLRQLTLPVGELPKALEIIARRTDEDLSRTLLALAGAWHGVNPSRLFTQGLKHVLAEPESADPDFMRKVIEFVEQPSSFEATEELSVLFDDSVAHVTAQLQLGSSQGTLVFVGPERMRYKESLSLAQGMTQTLTAQFSPELN